jgi:hypothetical protein
MNCRSANGKNNISGSQATTSMSGEPTILLRTIPAPRASGIPTIANPRFLSVRRKDSHCFIATATPSLERILHP